jgi:hypothetical protein
LVARQIALGLAASGLLAVLGWPVPALGAGSPSVPPAPSVQPDPTTEIWLDTPLDDAAVAGTLIHVPMTVWDTQRHQLSDLATTDARLLPRAGGAPATTATARADWPGHLVLDIEVPEGGAGELQIGYPGQACVPGGDCTPAFIPFTMGGIGPPPDAPTSALVVATLEIRPDPPEAGRATATSVQLVPKGTWPVELLGLPPSIEIAAGPAGEPDVAVATLHRAVGPDARFEGTLTLPAAGEVGLTARIPADRGRDDVLLVRRVVVQAAPVLLGTRSDGSGEEPPPILLVVALVGGLAVVAFAASRLLADL